MSRQVKSPNVQYKLYHFLLVTFSMYYLTLLGTQTIPSQQARRLVEKGDMNISNVKFIHLCKENIQRPRADSDVLHYAYDSS